MVLTTYDPASTMREARATYFAVNHFGDDGGYDEPWVDFMLGPIPFPFPNTASRKAALGFHDLHHIVTGYDTSFLGETEISSWEIGGGCGTSPAAWVLNLSGMGGGLLFAPRRSLRAFVRGLRSRTLYGQDLASLLDRSVADVRATTGVDTASEGPPRAREVALFAVAAAAGLVSGTAFLAVGVVLAPVGLVVSAIRRRSRDAKPQPA